VTHAETQPGYAGICECGCSLIQQRTWGKADVNQRRDLLARGFRLLQGRGMCSACYQHAHKAGLIPKRLKSTDAPKRSKAPCERCGIETTDQLCRDCEEVLDRDELALWRAS
jgi:hypothetical protein